MDTLSTLKTFEVSVPEEYADTLKQFIKALKGKIKAQKGTGLDEALEDIKAGKVTRYDNFDEFKQKMLDL